MQPYGVISRLALALSIAGAAYALVYRPLNLRWGATKAELQLTLPGDELAPAPHFLATRAMSIDAAPEAVWPWLVQIGYTRAGWYGYDWAENWVDGRIVPSAERIILELQQLAVGDTIPVSPIANLRVAAIEQGRALLAVGFDGQTTWAWVLQPLEGGRTRLLWRMRSYYHWELLSPVVVPLTDATDFVAVRQVMLGLKARAEGVPPEPPWRRNGEATLWFVTFLGFLTAEAWLVGREAWQRPAAIAPAAALITIVLVLTRPPLWADLLGIAVIGVGLWWARGSPPRLGPLRARQIGA